MQAVAKLTVTGRACLFDDDTTALVQMEAFSNVMGDESWIEAMAGRGHGRLWRA